MLFLLEDMSIATMSLPSLSLPACTHYALQAVFSLPTLMGFDS